MREEDVSSGNGIKLEVGSLTNKTTISGDIQGNATSGNGREARGGPCLIGSRKLCLP